MGRIEYLNDANAPRPNSLIPAASAVVINDKHAILLQRRTDNSLWSIPGGAMEPGESITECCKRETKEETGIEIEILRISGIYSNPAHIIEYSDGEIRQEFSVCFECKPVGGKLGTSSESSEVRYVAPDELTEYKIHPSILQRITDCLDNHGHPVIR